MLLEMRLDGYRGHVAAAHLRRLYLAAGGDDVRGEDRVEGPAGRAFAIRFHLHPDVRASVVQGGAAALLRLRSGTGWRLLATGAGIGGLEESVYLGRRDDVRRSQQVVLAGETDAGETVVKWALKRERGRRG